MIVMKSFNLIMHNSFSESTADVDEDYSGANRNYDLPPSDRWVNNAVMNDNPGGGYIR